MTSSDSILEAQSCFASAMTSYADPYLQESDSAAICSRMVKRLSDSGNRSISRRRWLTKADEGIGEFGIRVIARSHLLKVANLQSVGNCASKDLTLEDEILRSRRYSNIGRAQLGRRDRRCAQPQQAYAQRHYTDPRALPGLLTSAVSAFCNIPIAKVYLPQRALFNRTPARLLRILRRNACYVA